MRIHPGIWFPWYHTYPPLGKAPDGALVTRTGKVIQRSPLWSCKILIYESDKRTCPLKYSLIWICWWACSQNTKEKYSPKHTSTKYDTSIRSDTFWRTAKFKVMASTRTQDGDVQYKVTDEPPTSLSRHYEPKKGLRSAKMQICIC